MKTYETERIFGYSWEEIQAMQQGTYRAKTVTGGGGISPPTKSDYDLLEKFGSVEGIKNAGFFGTAERFEKVGAK